MLEQKGECVLKAFRSCLAMVTKKKRYHFIIWTPERKVGGSKPVMVLEQDT